MTDIVLPTDQTEGTSNVVGKWFKAVGDPVSRNEPLLEITTDKVTVEIAAPVSGVLAEILKPEGEAVEPGDVVGRIGEGRGGEIASAALRPRNDAEPPSERGGEPPDQSSRGGEAADAISPAVRRLLREHGLDAGQIKGTGRGGRITVQDVESHLQGAGKPGSQGAKSRLIPHAAMRRSIAEHMVKSVATAPHVTSVFEADLSAVIRHREAHQKAFTFTAYFVRASVAALQAVPEVNSRWQDQGLELYDDCNIGIGTALPGGGLIVPVLREAQALDLAETARRLEDLTTRARAGTLEPRDVQGGTFTISNHGVSGSLLAAPIVINQPQSAILGIGKLEQRVRVAAGGGFEARPMLYVTLTIDHRALDGFQANAFLSRWVEVVEQWS
ncbi:MAG TPA: 2-oxo acid dehydrogenase subunit E2 [Gemmatimonadales bacterium]|nr:2-oxo acid dehydrogenase subunit E2 [Gemmatimonadales bacterium]